MGICTSTHIGPFFKCIPTKGKVFLTKRFCSNTLCNNKKMEVWDKKKKFCELCGAGIVDFKHEVTENIQNPREICELEFKESLYVLDYDKEEFDIIVSNKKIDNLDLTLDNNCETQCVEITNEKITNQKNLFESYYNKEFNYLKEVYGDNVSICWGVICTRS